MVTVRFGDERIPPNFWARVHPEPMTGCWLWSGGETTGYGRYRADGRQRPAHRYAYERLVAPIPVELDCDHLCRMRGCVNPKHIEPVTRSVNLSRSPLMWPKKLKAQTHCKRGHELIPSNVYWTSQGGRSCRVCQNMHSKNYYRRKHPIVGKLKEA